MTDVPPPTIPPGAPPRARRILIIKPSSLGDVIHALPVLAALRSARPDAHIAWLVSNSFAPLLEGHPLLDEVIRFDRARYGRMTRSLAAMRDFWRFVAGLRRGKFDLVVDLQGLIRSGLLGVFSGAPHRLGFADAREGAWLFYSRRGRPEPDAEHAVDRNLHLLRAIGIRTTQARFPLGLRADERRDAARLLAQAAGEAVRSFTAVVPGTRWDSKRWPAEALGRLVSRMHAAGLGPCVLLGAPADRDFAAEVRAASEAPVVDLVGRTNLRQLAALIDASDRVVCHDSGPMHIAAALGKPTVAVFGPTNPARTGPYSPAAVVVRREMSCAPCYRRNCPLVHHDCMNRLEVDRVFAEIMALPDRNRHPAPALRR